MFVAVVFSNPKFRFLDTAVFI